MTPLGMFFASVFKQEVKTRVGRYNSQGIKVMFDLVSKVAGNIVTNQISKLVLGEEADKQVTEKTENTESESTEELGFEAVIKKFLPQSDDSNVSEEELFAAAVGQRIYDLKGQESLDKYQELLETEKLALTTASGHVQFEQAAINALKGLVADGSMSSAEGDSVYNEAFAAAQLDSDATALFDGKGGENDPTIAVAKMSEAMLKIKTFLEADADTRAEQPGLSLSSASQTGSAGSSAALNALLTPGLSSFSGSSETVNPNGTFVDGSEGFLFKPVTNNEGKLAVLFAQAWTNNIAAVRLLDQNGNLVEQGIRKPEGIAETGREKFTFSKTGGSYPSNINVEVQFKDGSLKMYNIPDPSKRYD